MAAGLARLCRAPRLCLCLLGSCPDHSLWGTTPASPTRLPGPHCRAGPRAGGLKQHRGWCGTCWDWSCPCPHGPPFCATCWSAAGVGMAAPSSAPYSLVPGAGEAESALPAAKGGAALGEPGAPGGDQPAHPPPSCCRYFINLCQRIYKGPLDCSERASVCKKSASGHVQVLGLVHTQRLEVAGEARVLSCWVQVHLTGKAGGCRPWREPPVVIHLWRFGGSWNVEVSAVCVT